MKLNPHTCDFANTNLTFLGHVENRDGTQLDPRRIKVNIKFLVPNFVTNDYDNIMSVAIIYLVEYNSIKHFLVAI